MSTNLRNRLSAFRLDMARRRGAGLRDDDAPGRARPRRRIALLAAVVVVGLVEAAPAGADTAVAGHVFWTSTANCAPNPYLHVWVGGNTNDYSTNRYVQVVMYDYTYAKWVYGGWHQVPSGWSLELDYEFSFGHHGYYYPELHYAVATSSGYQYGWETFRAFGQNDLYGNTRQSSTCYI